MDRNTSHLHFSGSQDQREGHESSGRCQAAYLAWEVAGGEAVIEGRTVRPTVQAAKKAVLIAIADLESEESVKRRVETWKDALPQSFSLNPTSGAD